MARQLRKCIFATHMRLWIAAFLISLFAFQAIPLTVLGKACLKAKISSGETPGDDGSDEDGSAPESGKMKKDGAQMEDYYLHPQQHHFGRQRFFHVPQTFAPELLVTAATGHARLHTPPPDRH